MKNIKFQDLYINERIKNVLNELDYIDLKEVQEKTMPLIFEEEDVLCLAQTNSGKTATFLIPIINKILKEKERFKIRALIISPTRELAFQIHQNLLKLCKYTNIRSLFISGGIKDVYQKQKLQQGIDIVIATPGRLIDFINQKVINLKAVNTFVLDEVDKLLDMGFSKDIMRINNILPITKQNLFFSATMTDSIRSICDTILRDPKEVSLSVNKTVSKTKQFICYVEQENKLKLLVDLIRFNKYKGVLVFCKTKIFAHKTSNFLRGFAITSDYINKDRTQTERNNALKSFVNKKIDVLVCTDVLSRGLDIDFLNVVINFDLPIDNETYIHRIGRVGRNNQESIAINFCSQDEKYLYDRLENNEEFEELKHNY